MLLPPGGLLLLASVGTVLLICRRRYGGFVAVAGLACLFLLSTPIVSAFLQEVASGNAEPVALELARSGQAVAILGGGVRRNAPEYGGDTLGRLTLDRVRYGARLARELGLPVLVAGGSPAGDTRPEAQLMREALENEYFVPVRWVEDRSRNTHENAQFSAGILRAAGVRRVVLVLHAFDVPRAREEFRRTGLDVIPAPTLVPRAEVSGIGDLLPSAAALLGSHYAVYELLAQRLAFLRD